MDAILKAKIDGMTYAQMLYLWRFSPSGNPLFQDDTGDYFRDAMFAKKNALDEKEQVRISKMIGWER